jgi:hypothetical protein
MLDNQLIDLLATQLEAASAAAGWNYIVVQKDQPTQQGIPTAPTIFFEKLFDSPHGWPIDSYVYQSAAGNFTETETQMVNTTFQISALVIQDPSNLALPTASDVANFMQQYLSARWSINYFMAQDVGLFRVTSIRNPAFNDDRTLYEYTPNFDITLTHSRAVSGVVANTAAINPGTIGSPPGAPVPPPALPNGTVNVGG